MIKKLRRKFILISMLSVFTVLAIIVGAANIISYKSITTRADGILTLLCENDGQFPKMTLNSNNKPNMKKPDPIGMSPETPYENRFFTIRYDSEGNVSSSDTGAVVAISTNDAIELANKVYAGNRTSGFESIYRYKVADTSNGKMIIFLDSSRDLITLQSFLRTSLLVSSLGLLGVFVLVLVLSPLAVKPIAESYEKQKKFITDASHEIKTPLTIIDANTEVIEMESGESEWTKSTKNQISRLTALTNNLVSLARMDEENRVIKLNEFSLSNAVRDEAEPFAAAAEASARTLKLNIQDGLKLTGDEKAIRHLVTILLDNALKYSNENGTVALTLKGSGKRSELSVYNTVESIKKGNLDIVFERFYRAETSRNSQTGGYGIGLSLAKSIVETHKGKISAKSRDGKSFIITAIF